MPEGSEGNGPRGRSIFLLTWSQKQCGHSLKSLSVEADSCGMRPIVRQKRRGGKRLLGSKQNDTAYDLAVSNTHLLSR